MTASRSDLATRDAEPAQTRLKEYALILPRLLKLVARLMRDPRVLARSKAALFLLAGYLASPVDLIPDFIPGLGQVDDLLLVVFALDQLLNRIPPDIVRDHWEGDEDVLEIVRSVIDMATAFVPKWLKRVFS